MREETVVVSQLLPQAAQSESETLNTLNEITGHTWYFREERCGYFLMVQMQNTLKP